MVAGGDADVSGIVGGGELREVGGHAAGTDIGEPVEGVAVSLFTMFGDGLGGFLRPKVVEGDVDGNHDDVVVTLVCGGGKEGVAIVASANVLAYLGNGEALGLQ